jgi:hypothetical protein
MPGDGGMRRETPGNPAGIRSEARTEAPLNVECPHVSERPDKPANPSSSPPPGEGGEANSASLAASLRVLEEKLAASDGIEPLVSLLGEVEALLAHVPQESLSSSRDEIRAVIERLLAINGELQRIARLKKLLP